MALQSSGPISLNEIHIEAGGTSGTICTINDSDIRGLISKASGAQMSFNEWYGASAGGDMSGFYVLTDEQDFLVGISTYAPGQVYRQSGSAPSHPQMSSSGATTGDHIAFGAAFAVNSTGANRLNSYSLERETSPGGALTNFSGSPVTNQGGEARAGYCSFGTNDDHSAVNVISANTTDSLNFFSEIFTVFNVANSSKSSYTTLTGHLYTSGTTASISNVSKHDVFILYFYARGSFTSLSETSEILNAAPGDDEAFFRKINSNQAVCAALVYAESAGTLSFSTTSSFSITDFFYVFQIS